MLRIVSCVALSCAVLLGAAWNAALAADPPKRMKWKIDGVAREALIYLPATAKKTASPIVFAFHGHGGTMKQAAASFAFQKHWPAAIVVYMQALKTPSPTDPEGKLPGWQTSIGGQEDRDFKFFDAVLERLKNDYKIDERRIYATGHSGGGAFTYLIWVTRGDQFAAFAPCAAAATFGGNVPAKPVFHMAGQGDKIVPFAIQQQTIESLRKLGQCDDGKPWGTQKWCTEYSSKTGTPVVACIHPGGHEMPAEVPAMIVKFFKEQAKAEVPAPK